MPDDAGVDRFARVVKDHLERFGQREQLDLLWSGRLTASSVARTGVHQALDRALGEGSRRGRP